MSDICETVFETLELLGGKKVEKSIWFIKNGLVIKHTPSGFKYTITKVELEDSDNPKVQCYRHDEDGNVDQFEITKEEFKDFEAV